MLKDLDDNVRFENISSGETNMVLNGISSFKEQAEQAKAFFSERKQTITSFKHEANETEVEIGTTDDRRRTTDYIIQKLNICARVE